MRAFQDGKVLVVTTRVFMRTQMPSCQPQSFHCSSATTTTMQTQMPVCQPQLLNYSSDTTTTTGSCVAGETDGQRLAPKPAGLLPGLGAGFAFLTFTSDALQGSLGLTLLSALMSAATCAATALSSDNPQQVAACVNNQLPGS